MNRRDALSALWLALAVAAGAAREFFFVNLNYQLDYLVNRRDRNYAHSRFRRWAEGLDAGDLTAWKWLLAAAFVALTAALTVALARTRFGDHRYRTRILGAFAALAAFALACHLGAQAAPALRPVSIAVLHALQYPVPLLVVWALSWMRQG
ncbi:MAG: hypothetical protein QY325_01710 [Flavobacteriales bacterium]|nr:MAG: hypothetical protein QY325_01710 [Flavobacteriales bacterium]